MQAIATRIFGRDPASRAGFAAVAVAIACWLISLTGMLAPLDTQYLGRLSQWASAKASPDRVLIVDIAPGQAHASAALRARLQALGAAVVVPPADGNARRCVPDIHASLALRYPPVADGRCDRLGSALPGGWPKARSLSPDFAITTSTGIPRFDAAHLLGEAPTGPLSGLVKGRVVLLESGWTQPAYVTPLHARDGLLPAATLDALMVESILDRREIRWASPVIGLTWLLAVMGAWWLLADRRVPRLLRHRTIVLAALVPGLSAALVATTRLFVPPSAALCALAVAGLWSYLQHRRRLDRKLDDVRTILRQATRRDGLQQWKAESPDETQEWSRLASLAANHFGAIACVALRLPPDSSLLKIASTYPDALDGDDRTGIDHRESPWSEASASGRAIEVATDTFDSLQPHRPKKARNTTPDQHRCALVAIRHAGQLAGFMALKLDAGQYAASASLANDLSLFARAAAQSVLLARTTPEPSAGAPGFAGTRELMALTADARIQIEVLRDLFTASPHPSAAMDVEGRILFSNPAFSDFAHATGKALLSMRLQDMLTTLCGMSEPDALGECRRLLLHQSAVEHLMLPGASPVPSSLRVYPISIDHSGRRTGPSPQIETRGFCLEFTPAMSVDTRLTGLCNAGERLLHAASAELDALSMHMRDRNTDATMGEAFANLRTALEDFGTQLRLDRSLQAIAKSECDLLMLFERVAHEKFGDMQRRGISLQRHGERSLLADLSPATAHAVLDAAVSLLLHDAANDSLLTCDAHRSTSHVTLRLRNEGFGVPEWHLRTVKDHSTIATAGEDPLALLLAKVSDMNDAGCELVVESVLGEGFVVVLRVPSIR